MPAAADIRPVPADDRVPEPADNSTSATGSTPARGSTPDAGSTPADGSSSAAGSPSAAGSTPAAGSTSAAGSTPAVDILSAAGSALTFGRAPSENGALLLVEYAMLAVSSFSVEEFSAGMFSQLVSAVDSLLSISLPLIVSAVCIASQVAEIPGTLSYGSEVLVEVL